MRNPRTAPAAAADIAAGLDAIWHSLTEASAVAGCIPLVTTGSPEEERVVALAGAVANLLTIALRHLEQVEVDARRQQGATAAPVPMAA